MKKILIYALAIFIGVSCAEDKGNYAYKDINTITQDEVYGTYRVERFDNLVIPCPKLTFALDEIKDLSYEWQIDYKVVSTEKDLNVKVTAELGRQKGILTITDNATKLKYYFEFQVNVETKYVRGVHFLVEKENGESSLSFLRRDIEPPYVFLMDIYHQENPEMGELGRKPVQLVVGKDNNQTTNIYVLNGEGENKIAVLKKETLKLSQILNENVITGTDVIPDKFNPTYMANLVGSLIVADNRVYMYDLLGTKTLYNSSNVDCKFSSYAYTYNVRAYSHWYLFDENISKLVMLSAKPFGEGDALALNQVTPLDGNTENYSLKSAGFIEEIRGTGKETAVYQLAMYDKPTKTLAFYDQLSEYTTDIQNVVLSVKNTVTLKNKLTNIADENSIYFYAPATRYWYIATGPKLYKKYYGTDVPELIWTSKTGDIKAITANLGEYGMEEIELYVATYDATSSNAKKSSFYVIDTKENKSIEEYEYVLDKCVSIAFVTYY